MLPLLKRVSRSFYLSIRLLPAGMREPVAVAYLLARATDTVADTASIDVARRAELLEELAKLVGTSAHPTEFAEGADRELIAAVPECLRSLGALPEGDQRDVREVLGHITRGQQLDLQRPILQTTAELDEYTYLVAGCVGEFWTRVAHRHVPGFSSLPVERMLALGRSYGQGLQLVNILRDAREDATLGRNYLPPEQPGKAYWMARARTALGDGMDYSLALGSRRLRIASALPALLGFRTLQLLGAAGPDAGKVKVPRGEVRSLLWRVALGLGSRATLGTLRARWDNPRP